MDPRFPDDDFSDDDFEDIEGIDGVDGIEPAGSAIPESIPTPMDRTDTRDEIRFDTVSATDDAIRRVEAALESIKLGAGKIEVERIARSLSPRPSEELVGQLHDAAHELPRAGRLAAVAHRATQTRLTEELAERERNNELETADEALRQAIRTRDDEWNQVFSPYLVEAERAAEQLSGTAGDHESVIIERFGIAVRRHAQEVLQLPRRKVTGNIMRDARERMHSVRPHFVRLVRAELAVLANDGQHEAAIAETLEAHEAWQDSMDLLVTAIEAAAAHIEPEDPASVVLPR